MLDKIRFPLVFDGNKTNGMLYIHGTDVKLDKVTYMIKNIFPKVCEYKHNELLKKEFNATYFSYHRDAERTYVAISTSLHFFKLELRDGVYNFNVYDYKSSEIIRDYSLDDLTDSISFDVLSDMFSATTDDEHIFQSMMETLYLIIVERFLTK